MREQVREYGLEGRVIFAGVRRDAERLYSAMDVFCLPSLYEGFPVVIPEALANGLPVVCSDRVSEEVCLTSQVVRLPLGDDGQWAAALRAAERTAGGIPEKLEISRAVKLLEEKYTEICR